MHNPDRPWNECPAWYSVNGGPIRPLVVTVTIYAAYFEANK